MGNFLKVLGGLALVGGIAAAVLAIKKRKDMEEYDYEEFDDCDCDCDCCCDDECDCDDCNDENVTDDVEADLDKVEEPVEEVDE